jgi:hypothetical protein
MPDRGDSVGMCGRKWINHLPFPRIVKDVYVDAEQSASIAAIGESVANKEQGGWLRVHNPKSEHTLFKFTFFLQPAVQFMDGLF